jgi:hypothetical protein
MSTPLFKQQFAGPPYGCGVNKSHNPNPAEPLVAKLNPDLSGK